MEKEKNDQLVYEVIDSLDKSKSVVRVSHKQIDFGDYYLFLKNGKPISIELCDSEGLSKEINKNKYKKGSEVYLKIEECDKSLPSKY